MKSKTLSASLIWDNCKRQIWLFALILAAFLFLFPLNEMQSFGMWKQSLGVLPSDIYREYLEFIRVQLSVNGMPILAAAALANGVFGFWWLHSRQKIDFYHSLPIRRESLYGNQFLTGLLFYGVPLILTSVICLCIGAAEGYFNLEIAGAMAQSVGLQFLTYWLLYSLAVIAMMLTGRILVGALGAVALAVYLPGVLYLMGGMSEVFFTTYSFGFMGHPLMEYGLSRYGSPLTWMLCLVSEWEKGRPLPAVEILVAVGVAVLLTLLGLWLCRKRPSESAGTSMVFRPVAKVVKFLVEIPAALVVGLLSYVAAPSDMRMIWWIAGLIVGLILAHGIMEVIYQMDFKSFFRHRIELGIEAVLVAVVAAVFIWDLTGYDAYLPKQEELSYISLLPSDLRNENRVILTGEPLSYENISYEMQDEMEQMKLTPDDALYDLMQGIVEARTHFRWEEGAETEEATRYLWVNYVLKNGKTVTRRYSFTMEEELENQISNLWNRQDVLDGFYGDLEQKKAYLYGVRWESYGESEELYHFNDPDQTEIVDAILADVAEADKATFQEEPLGCLILNYGQEDEESIASDTVNVYPGFARTKVLLEEREMPILETWEDADIVEVKIEDYRLIDRGESNKPKTLTYTDPKEIQEILPYLRKNNHSYRNMMSKEREDSIYVSVRRKDKNGNLVYMDCGFENGNLPEGF